MGYNLAAIIIIIIIANLLIFSEIQAEIFISKLLSKENMTLCRCTVKRKYIAIRGRTGPQVARKPFPTTGMFEGGPEAESPRRLTGNELIVVKSQTLAL